MNKDWEHELDHKWVRRQRQGSCLGAIIGLLILIVVVQVVVWFGVIPSLFVWRELICPQVILQSGDSGDLVVKWCEVIGVLK